MGMGICAEEPKMYKFTYAADTDSAGFKGKGPVSRGWLSSLFTLLFIQLLQRVKVRILQVAAVATEGSQVVVAAAIMVAAALEEKKSKSVLLNMTVAWRSSGQGYFSGQHLKSILLGGGGGHLLISPEVLLLQEAMVVG